MLGKMALTAMVGITVLGVSIASSLASRDDVRDNNDRGGSVVPCSLAGVNPAYHPEVFGSPAAAAQYGFIRSPNGAWHVAPNCHH